MRRDASEFRAEEIALAARPGSATASICTDLKVLVVDDNASSRAALEECLARLGHAAAARRRRAAPCRN